MRNNLQRDSKIHGIETANLRKYEHNNKIKVTFAGLVGIYSISDLSSLYL